MRTWFVYTPLITNNGIKNNFAFDDETVAKVFAASIKDAEITVREMKVYEVFSEVKEAYDDGLKSQALAKLTDSDRKILGLDNNHAT